MNNNNDKQKMISCNDVIDKEMFKQVVLPLLQNPKKGKILLANITDNKTKPNNNDKIDNSKNK